MAIAWVEERKGNFIFVQWTIMPGQREGNQASLKLKRSLLYILQMATNVPAWT